MNKILLGFGMASIPLLMSGCDRAPAATDPQGPAAATIYGLSWQLIGLGSLIYVVVSGLLLYALFRRRVEQASTEEGTEGVTIDRADRPVGRRLVIWGGMVMPAVVLLVVGGLALNTLLAFATDPLGSTSSGTRPTDTALAIEVIGHQWWWEVIYPDAKVTTANEIHIPTGQPVQITLRAEGVIHSFWVPQLHGKLDMIPGRTNRFYIQADETGEFRGICAEFCGIQHARMLFLVVAHPPETFAQWLTAQQQPAATPESTSAQKGQALFLETPCAQCHAVAGTTAAGRLGPDLTHFASRREIGAGTLANTRENLAAWLTNPQEKKTGNLMPATTLSTEELEALLDYLATLE
ncbi:MAG TPA: cytochrome c oxidase subunit II [Caldilineaceae bacterium]|nr:cytochrome c oxidase subunit II [Caldilineaceae bacterium]